MSGIEPAKITDIKPLVFAKPESFEKSDCLPSIYTYTVMNLEGHSDLKGLVVCRFEEEPCRKLVLYEKLRSHHIDDLAVICDEIDPDRLIGQTFSSYKPLPCEALEEHLDIHRRYVNAVNSEEFTSCYLQVCAGCKLLHGAMVPIILFVAFIHTDGLKMVAVQISNGMNVRRCFHLRMMLLSKA